MKQSTRLEDRLHRAESEAAQCLLVKKAAQEGGYTELFTMPPGTATTEEYYFGFSGWSGSKAYIQVDLNFMDARNFDETKAGQDTADVIGASDADVWAKVLEEEKALDPVEHHLAMGEDGEADREEVVPIEPVA